MNALWRCGGGTGHGTSGCVAAVAVILALGPDYAGRVTGRQGMGLSWGRAISSRADAGAFASENDVTATLNKWSANEG